MLEIFNKLKTTLKREGLLASLKKISRRITYKSKRTWKDRRPNAKKWKELKGKYKGERVFLIGNGPSLNKTPLYLLKNEYKMCFNHFYIMRDRLNWFPEFYMATDNLVIDDLLDKIPNIAGDTGMFFLPDIHFRGKNYENIIEDHHNLYWLEQKHGKGFSQHLPTAYLGGSVIYEGFQVLNYLGFEEIYFVGVDMNFQIHTSAKGINSSETDIVSQNDDDPNHFDPRYFGKDKTYHQPEDYIINFILGRLKYLSAVAENIGLKICNAGYDSSVDYFERTDFESILDFTEEEKKDLLDDCFKQNTHYDNLDEFLEKSTELNVTGEWDEELDDFWIEKEKGISLISEAVFTHIPIGPFDNKYYFVKRN